MSEALGRRSAGPTVGRWLGALTAGLLAFVGSWVTGVVVTVLVIRQIPPEVPHPTEAYEGFGDAMRALVLFYLGAGMAFLVAVVVGVAVSTWVAYRGISRPAADPDPAA